MYTHVTDIKGLSKFVATYQDAEYLSIDTETTGLDPFIDKVHLIQVKAKDTTFIFNVKKLGEKQTKYLVSLIKDSGKLCLFHNAKFDVKMLFTNFGEMLENIYDTQLAETLLTNGINKNWRSSLALLVEKYENVVLDKTVRNNFICPEDSDVDTFYRNFEVTEQDLVYSALDVEYLASIREKQLKVLEEQRQLQVLELENRLVPVVSSMELNGVPLNTVRWKELLDLAEQECVRLREELFNIILSRLKTKLKKCTTLQELYDLLKIPYKSTKKNLEIITQPVGYDLILLAARQELNLNSTTQLLQTLNQIGFKLKSTSDDALNELDSSDQLISLIKKYRAKSKLVSSFGENFLNIVHPLTNRIHTQFNQLGARSGRFSSGGSDDGQNLQNIVADPEYRKCFVADQGWKIVGGDFSQEEYRLAGAITGERVIIEAYKNGLDMHISTAALVNKVSLQEVTKAQRKDAKPVNFSILYGTSAYGMAKKQKIPLKQAEDIVSAFYGGYPTLALFQKAFQDAVIQHGFSTTLYGRKRFFDVKRVYTDHRERERELASFRREGFNHIIQGTGADIIKLALCRIYYENPFGDNLKIILTVHDEIQCMVKEEFVEESKVFIKKCMEEVEQEFLGEIPAVADIDSADYWNH